MDAAFGLRDRKSLNKGAETERLMTTRGCPRHDVCLPGRAAHDRACLIKTVSSPEGEALPVRRTVNRQPSPRARA